MQQKDTSNTLFNLAADLVNHTARHVFITGKAGTGKTTFLKYVKEHTQKNTVVVAPTGVAAINAGGVTMHSFFQLPFGSFIPASLNRFNGTTDATDKHSLFRNIHFTSNKREMLQELELLIIDEVSMVRADMLDAMDTILRHFRKQPMLPFGGVQVVYIGDMYQLPPVIPQHEWSLLQQYYDSPFFFDAKVIKEAQPLYIELKKIYRQNEQHFIDILNRIRNNIVQAGDLTELNKRFSPSFMPPAGEKFITLTTHNRKADVINEAELKKLTTPLHTFEAEVKGEFSDKALPTELRLQLKAGAQIMFIKNDSGAERKYYNGKLGLVKRIYKEEVIIAFENGEEDLKLEKETWKNIRYTYNKEEDDIEEEELGSFKQYPIRLAWAITIHKSQGLTFDKAVIDAGASFAAGQVYVALSRCTSLDGLVLQSKIYSNAIATDPRVIAFAQKEANDEELERLLKEEKERYQSEALIKAFGWGRITKAVSDWRDMISAARLPSPEEAFSLNEALLHKAYQLAEVADKFQNQLRQIIAQKNNGLLLQRVNKALHYFAREAVTEILEPLQAHLAALQYATKIKKYIKELQSVEAILIQYLERINAVQYGELTFEPYPMPSVRQMPALAPLAKKTKAEKGASQKDSLVLFRQGKTISEIAQLRNLSAGTVEGHLASFVYTGEIAIEELVEKEKVATILEAIDRLGLAATTIKRVLGEAYSFGEIRAVMNEHRRQQEQKKEAV